MGFAKYSTSDARIIAERVYNKYGSLIEEAADRYGIPPEWLAGMTGMENPNCYEWPDRRAKRFEAGVFRKLKYVRNTKGSVYAKKIPHDMLKGLSDEALVNLATSWGQMQIMGYYILTIFEGSSVAELRDPRRGYLFAGEMMTEDPQLRAYLRAKKYDQVCHIWNSGRIWDGTTKGIKTYTPYYMGNCDLVRAEYVKIRNTKGIPNKIPEITDTQKGKLETMLSSNRNLFAEEDVDVNDLDKGQEVDFTTEALPGITQTSVPTPKPGYKTTEFWIVTLMGILVTLGVTFGWFSRATGDKINAFVSGDLLTIIGYLAVVWQYITSRGKTKSNSIWANASVAATANAAQAGTEMALLGGGKKRILGGILGGVINSLPGGAPALEVARQLGGEKINKGLDKIGLGDEGENVRAEGRMLSDADITEAFGIINTNVKTLNQHQKEILTHIQHLSDEIAMLKGK